jgi:ankyrin repeat protein
MQLFIEAGIDVNWQRKGEYTYRCPLGYAVKRMDLKLVNQLLELGADPSSIAGPFGPILGQAITSGTTDIATLLIEKGANVNTITEDMRSPLGAAMGACNEDVIKALLEAGADPNIGDGYVLGIACQRGKIHIV